MKPSQHQDPAEVVAELRNGANVSGVGPRVANLAAEFIEQQAKALSEAEAEREYISRSHSRLAADFQTQADKFDAEIAVKEARLAEAMRVIEPFALIAEHDIGSDETDSDSYQPMTYNTVPRISIGHLRAARSFLNSASNKVSR